MTALENPVEVLRVSAVPPFLMTALQEHFIMHDNAHITDPGALGRVRAIVGGGECKVDDKLLSLLPKVEIISVCGVGYDGVDVEAAKRRGIMVTHTPDVLNDDVADMAIGLMLSISRKMPQADRFVRNNDWVDGPFPLTKKMTGARLGLVGMGRIGQAIARRAQAFDMKISYTARSPRADVPYTFVHNARELASQVDFLVAITPGGDGTRGLISAEVLAALGPQGYFVNVARGSVVDQGALIHALQNKQIAGAGLDVYIDEPRVPAELRALQNVVLSPHCASGTVETRKAMAGRAMDNLLCHFAGKPLPSPVPECRAAQA